MTDLATADDVSAAIAAIAVLDRDLAKIQGKLDKRVLALKRIAESKAAPLTAERQACEAAVRKYCDAHRAELVDGKRKTARFAAGEAGWRLGRAKLEVDPTREDSILARLAKRGLDRFIRVTRSLNAQAVLNEPAEIKGIPGLKIVPASEAFWIKPAALEIAAMD